MNSPLLFLGDIGGSELILIMVVILIFFGANKIPELARGLGKGIREFKDASSEIRNEFERAGQQSPNQPYNNQGYNPNQPYQQQNPAYGQQPAPYQPAPGAPTPLAGDYVAPVAGYTAPGAVDLPTAGQPTFHQSTPIPPTADAVHGTQPRLDQPSTDV
ncbi:twin-arginine translocase TatA/TatE family subunit [Hymenobacter sp. BRD67]|uniref:twin-arginine translocase TatA/TatE family subunit n=1 Tax=Hymenobacter sp. BRD67 TaxID=2675877 RepID=UPI001563DFE0|nr:twin-arginine translocase TatA/TatE family subunit [Hymenobacter sp. BRD67]QKG53366.1 twin-arginine translocase TatA/TatE family subunit [Hymenobacter sp. BRD67]